MTRLIDTFFYGLYMDQAVLAESGGTPRSPRRASAGGFAVKIGKRATMVRAPGGAVWGMVFSLTPEELGKLYGAPGLEAYQPQDIEVALENRAIIPARVYLLPQAPAPDERNVEYEAKLKAVLQRLGFPADHVAGVG